MGVATGDYDNDGDWDLYVTNFGSNVLYRNNGNGTFTDVTRQVSLSIPIRSIHSPGSRLPTRCCGEAAGLLAGA